MTARRTLTVLALSTLTMLAVAAAPTLAQDAARGKRAERAGRAGRAGNSDADSQRKGANDRDDNTRDITEQMLQRLPDHLKLDDAQRAKYDEIVTKYRDRLTELRAQGAERRALAGELRDAQRAGDKARVEELRKQLRELGSPARDVLGQFFDEVETILTPEQKQQLKELRSEWQQRIASLGADRSLQMLLRLPDLLNLDGAQRDKFEEIAANARETFRQYKQELELLTKELSQARDSDDEARIKELHTQIAQKRAAAPTIDTFLKQLEPSLTTEQKAKLAKFRERLNGVRTRPEATRRGERAAKGADNGAAPESQPAERPAGRSRNRKQP